MAISRLIAPSSNRPIIDQNGAMNQDFRFWIGTISNYAMIIGQGSPEAVVGAIQGALYLDSSGIAGNILYVKRDPDISGDTTKGWILV